jgi:hypothetical protein
MYALELLYNPGRIDFQTMSYLLGEARGHTFTFEEITYNLEQ